jgi:hypothetical protein
MVLKQFLTEKTRLLVTVAVLGISCWLWILGLTGSPVFTPALVEENRYVRQYIQEQAPDYQEVNRLARAYWKRYPDVRNHKYFGKNGPMGIFGAREHFEQHGRREGRIYAPLHVPDDLERERKLAEAYWRRYPAVEQSDIWGRDSELGILGPRDHYQYYGRKHGYSWGDNP